MPIRPNPTATRVANQYNAAAVLFAYTLITSLLALPGMAHAEFFTDCKSIPGEYIVKFKEVTGSQNAGSSGGSAISVVNSKLQATHVETVTSTPKSAVVTVNDEFSNFEFVKSPLPHQQIEALLASQLFKDNVEYIQIAKKIDRFFLSIRK